MASYYNKCLVEQLFRKKKIYTPFFFCFFTTNMNPINFDNSMLSKDSNSSNALGESKFWSSSSSSTRQAGGTFQPLGKEEPYRYPLIRSETFPPTKDETFSTPYSTVASDYDMPTNKYMKNTMINAPSYIPFSKSYYPKHDSFDALQEDYNKLKGELILKNQIIKNLTDQISIMSKPDQASFMAPKNHYQLFQDLLKTLQEKSTELLQTNQRLEAVLVANSENYNVEELSHKLVHRLTQLQQENENLLKIISFGNKTNLLIEIGLLKHEIEVLKGMGN